MKLAVNHRVAGLAAISALALTLTACGQDATTDTTSSSDATGESSAAETSAASLSGSLAGAGASSQEKGQNAWIAEFGMENPDLTISYDPSGSGNGRTAFIDGSVQFAGSDSVMKTEEIEAATARCEGSEPIEVPLWISPIAVVYNLPSLDAEHINMSADTIAKIFSGQITKWNDPELVEQNPDIELPDADIIPVNRSDESGTTKNFTQYLADAAPDVWTYEPDEVWPLDGTQSGAQTSGLLEVVEGAEGTIGYVDASRAGDLGTVAVGVGDEYVPFSAEAAAKIVDISEPTEDATDLRLTLDLARDTTESGVYPIVLVSYLIACSTYADEQDATNVKAYLEYIASEEGQDLAASADVAGIAPISDDLRTKVMAALETITVAG